MPNLTQGTVIPYAARRPDQDLASQFPPMAIPNNSGRRILRSNSAATSRHGHLPPLDCRVSITHNQHCRVQPDPHQTNTDTKEIHRGPNLRFPELLIVGTQPSHCNVHRSVAPSVPSCAVTALKWPATSQLAQYSYRYFSRKRGRIP